MCRLSVAAAQGGGCAPAGSGAAGWGEYRQGGSGMVGELEAGDPGWAGPYRLVGRLGAGGMGQVFLGRSGTGALAAVKVIRPELAGEPGFRERFAREVAAAANVSGQFTALVLDADVRSATPWLATAYVAGPSLAEAVATQGPLPVPAVLTLAAGLAQGLGAIHAAGLVHRDLKPSNVLLAGDGPRVIDFGISRSPEASMLTQTGMVVGSPGFMSPEQAVGRYVGPRSDVFSLGAVLAFAATGRHPFGTGTAPSLMYRVVHDDPDLSGLPGPVWPLVTWCLAKDPGLRPGTGDLLARLGGARRAAPSANRHRAPAAAATPLVAAAKADAAVPRVLAAVAPLPCPRRRRCPRCPRRAFPRRPAPPRRPALRRPWGAPRWRPQSWSPRGGRQPRGRPSAARRPPARGGRAGRARGRGGGPARTWPGPGRWPGSPPRPPLRSCSCRAPFAAPRPPSLSRNSRPGQHRPVLRRRRHRPSLRRPRRAPRPPPARPPRPGRPSRPDCRPARRAPRRRTRPSRARRLPLRRRARLCRRS